MTTSRSPNKSPAGEAALALIYFVAAFAAAHCTRGPEGVTLFWPADAIAAAAFVRFPNLRWPRAFGLLYVAGLLAERLSGAPGWGTAAAWAGTRLLDVALMTAAVTRVGRYQFPRVTLTQASLATVLFSVLAPGVAALAGGLAHHLAVGAPFRAEALRCWSSAALGACVFAPPVLLYSSEALGRLQRPRFLAANLATLIGCVAGI
ncbi:MAG TPA: MASE1 domain-containing protein, partial [Steroidobacteraceae bacterium]|nr:MASE1 domain-containing protein [Steroidobacteraceae bacterium]